jgi:hypothetical protein
MYSPLLTWHHLPCHEYMPYHTSSCFGASDTTSSTSPNKAHSHPSVHMPTCPLPLASPDSAPNRLVSLLNLVPSLSRHAISSILLRMHIVLALALLPVTQRPNQPYRTRPKTQVPASIRQRTTRPEGNRAIVAQQPSSPVYPQHAGSRAIEQNTGRPTTESRPPLTPPATLAAELPSLRARHTYSPELASRPASPPLPHSLATVPSSVSHLSLRATCSRGPTITTSPNLGTSAPRPSASPAAPSPAASPAFELLLLSGAPVAFERRLAANRFPTAFCILGFKN